MADRVQVVGARELRAQMRKAGVDVKDMKDANARAGSIVANAARGMAPQRSGALAGSIRPARAVSGVTVRAGNARVPYSGPIHWGWPVRGIRANPFLSIAATGTEPQWLAIYMQGVDKAIAQCKGKAP